LWIKARKMTDVFWEQIHEIWNEINRLQFVDAVDHDGLPGAI
jgi:hypothetical protein